MVGAADHHDEPLKRGNRTVTMHASHRWLLTRATVLLTAATLASGCAVAAPRGSPDASTATESAAPRATDAPGATGSAEPTANRSSLFDSSAVHEISVSFDSEAYDAMIETYAQTDDKEWIEATVTIDGRVYERAGIRLKGNSSLMGLDSGGDGAGRGPSADAPESLPWLVDLDRFVDGQNHDGVVEFVVRSNGSATALNEAVALELLEQAGLASQDAVAVRFSVNGSDQVLRLAVEHPDDAWMADAFDASGTLYKAESTGDWRYRGKDPEAYEEAFDQEAGDENADLTPLIEFLDFLHNADDASFAAEIEDRLDVDAFATYLAMQELVANFDDIDGPGNNSYLYYDTSADRFTVVPWDYNLAFVSGPGEGGFPGGGVIVPPGAGDGDVVMPPGDGDAGGDIAPPPGHEGGFVPLEGAGDLPGVEFGGRSNVLTERFLAIAEYRALVDERKAELEGELFESGLAAEILAEWVTVLEADASDLVDPETIATEAEQVAAHFGGTAQ